ncbi:hypothetical protein diail_2245 [Diaporthe ilicicola]|nr:hypothetical protein diail_2245 [Diaporthe ilicicola]
MASKNEGTVGWRFLPTCLAIVLSLVGTAEGHASGDDLTAQVTTTTTLLLTRTITIQVSKPTALQSEEMKNGEVYIVQGCFGQDGPSDVGNMLGSDFTVRNATGKDGMSLSMCLGLCGSPATPEIEQPDGQHPSLYVGLSDGKACYCGASLNSTAKEVQAMNCTMPCAGNNAVACGGSGFMLIYKLSTQPEPAKKPGDGPYDDGAGSKAKPGVTAGIALGSISGFGMLLLLIFYGAKIYKRRRQRQASGSDRHDPGAGEGDDSSVTAPARDAASLGNASRVDLRRVSPMVLDFSALDGNGRASNAGRPKEIIAASTGADWRMGSPDTPKGPAPRLAPNATGNEAWDNIPDTPMILVQHPESVAQNPGLGERAWHRRRLSTPLPPAGYDGSGSTTGSGGPREACEPVSQGPGGGDLNAWEDPWGSLVPAPLTLPPLNRDVDGASTPPEEDGGPLSPRWTLWTLPSDPSLSESSSGNSVGRGAKTGKKK